MSSNKSNKKDNLIIGCINNYLWWRIEPFFLSWKEYLSCDSHLVVFCGNISERVSLQLSALGVEIIPIAREYLTCCPNDYRYKSYFEYLQEHNYYKKVLLTDIRDVVFQGNVFDVGEKEFLFLAEESQTIADNIVNKNWIIKQFGKDVCDGIKNNSVACSGTILGSYRIVNNIVNDMCYIMFSGNYPYFEICDQSTYNYIVYQQKKYNEVLIKSSEREGVIATIGTIEESLAENNNIDVKNGDVIFGGYKPFLIHQYDRIFNLFEIIQNKYESITNSELFNGVSILIDKEKNHDVLSCMDEVYFAASEKNLAVMYDWLNKVFELSKNIDKWNNICWDDIAMIFKKMNTNKSEVYYKITNILIKLLEKTRVGIVMINSLVVLINLVRDYKVNQAIIEDSFYDMLIRVNNHFISIHDLQRSEYILAMIRIIKE